MWVRDATQPAGWPPVTALTSLPSRRFEQSREPTKTATICDNYKSSRNLMRRFVYVNVRLTTSLVQFKIIGSRRRSCEDCKMWRRRNVPMVSRLCN